MSECIYHVGELAARAREAAEEHLRARWEAFASFAADPPRPTFDVQRIALRPGDTVVVTSERPFTMEQADRIKARISEVFPGHRAIVMSSGLTISAVGSDDEDESPTPAIPE